MRADRFSTHAVACSLTVILLGGCTTTNLQKADRSYQDGKYNKALEYYLKEYDTQKKAAELPQWQGSRYRYVFNANDAAVGLRGAAKSAEALGDERMFRLLQVRLAAFLARNGLGDE